MYVPIFGVNSAEPFMQISVEIYNEMADFYMLGAAVQGVIYRFSRRCSTRKDAESRSAWCSSQGMNSMVRSVPPCNMNALSEKRPAASVVSVTNNAVLVARNVTGT